MDKADNPLGVEVVAYIDDDDDSYDNFNFYQTRFIRGPRIVLSEMWNKCWQNANGDILGHMGDDIIFRTKGWDTIVRSAFDEYPDKFVFIYGSDGNGESERNKFGTHGFVHQDWANVVGYFVPPYFSSDYNDLWLNDVAKAIGRHRFVDILTEHMHYTLGKSEIDDNTKERLARHAADNVERIYEDKKDERQADIEKLKEAIGAKADNSHSDSR